MPTIELSIGGNRFVLKGEENEEHLREVSELVKRKIENIRKRSPSIGLQKATMLAAIDFASEAIKGRKKALDYRNRILAQANVLLEKIESELSSRPDGSSIC